jgi:hypothetical protein
MSALALKRKLGLGSYCTAWTCLHKLRRAMVRPGRDRLSGTVEVDEIYIGGVKKGNRGRGADGKEVLMANPWCSWLHRKTAGGSAGFGFIDWRTHPPPVLFQQLRTAWSPEV